MSTIDRNERYCIIGAGPAGLLAARSFKQAGIAYDQFDMNPDVGGIWDIRNEWTPMYQSAHFISSKTVSNLPAYEMPDEFPDYPRHDQIFQYLQSFASDYDLYPGIRFSEEVRRVEHHEGRWRVTLGSGESDKYAGVVICNGNTWDPNWPEYPGSLDGEVMHAVRYREPDIFRGKRVLIVGGGNSACDIACDAAANADAAFISLRRGYHFIPKYIFGIPSDLFAQRSKLPLWLETRVFGALLRLLVGDLRGYGLPKPDHPVLSSHPIINSQLLHHLGHGDIGYKPDVRRLKGTSVEFVDGSAERIDLVVYATGYKVTYPFMDRSHFQWLGKYPDLYLSSLHRNYDNICCLGLHQTDGGAFDFFAMQADMMANFILDQRDNPTRARRFAQQKRSDRRLLRGGREYVDSPRHQTYVRKAVFRDYCDQIFRDYGWTRFSLLDPRKARVDSGRPETGARRGGKLVSV